MVEGDDLVKDWQEGDQMTSSNAVRPTTDKDEWKRITGLASTAHMGHKF